MSTVRRSTAEQGFSCWAAVQILQLLHSRLESSKLQCASAKNLFSLTLSRLQAALSYPLVQLKGACLPPTLSKGEGHELCCPCRAEAIGLSVCDPWLVIHPQHLVSPCLLGLGCNCPLPTTGQMSCPAQLITFGCLNI